MTVKFVEGRNQHLFLDNDSNGIMRQIRGEIILGEEYLRRIFDFNLDIFNINSLNRRIYSHIIAPNKETSLRAFLPDGVIYEQYGDVPFRQYMNLFPDAKNFTFFDRDLLSWRDSGVDFYYPLDDSHWTSRGARHYLTAAFQATGLGKLASLISDLAVAEVEDVRCGDLGKHAGWPARTVNDIKVNDPKAVTIFEGDVTNEGYVRHCKCSVASGRAVILHDSFVHAAFQFLSEIFGESLFLHCPDYPADLVENFNPDFVIRIQAERFFTRTPSKLDSVRKWLLKEEGRKSTTSISSAYLSSYSAEKDDIYEIVSVKELRGIEILRCLAPCMITSPPVKLKNLIQMDRNAPEINDGDAAVDEYGVLDGVCYVIPEAVVHGECGIVTHKRYLVEETLYSAFPELWGMERIDQNRMYIPEFGSDVVVDRAAHALSGAGGSRSYRQWLSNVVPALRFYPFYDEFEKSVVLMPSIRNEWQLSILEILPELGGRAAFLGQTTKFFCNSLRFVPRLLWSEQTPHPDRSKIYGEIRRRVGGKKSRDERIFIKSSFQGRRLLNEAELVEVAERYGFRAVSPDGLPFRVQVEEFSNSKFTICACDELSVNVAFADSGSYFLEIAPDDRHSVSNRRLCAITGVEYGLLLGANDETRPSEWTLSTQVFEAALRDMLA